MPLLVSIHAPWEGCDQHLFYCEDRTDSFNSRTLGRVRPLSSVTFICASMFQFTHPGKGATILVASASRSRYRFNSRTLGRVRLLGVAVERVCVVFQFTHPGKGATASPYLDTNLQEVSIHAPWEGCDYLCVLPPLSPILFQFTHPGKGATVIFDSFMSM